MDREELIVELQDTFQFILEDDRILGLFLFGSYATYDQTPMSDVDLCFIVPNKSQIKNVYSSVMKHAINFRDEYDIRFFEEFPLHVKIQVIEKGIPLVGRDIPAIYEYFWIYRQMWEDFQFTVLKAQ